MGCGHSRELPEIFGVPILSQDRLKLRASNFLRTFIHSIDRNKSP